MSSKHDYKHKSIPSITPTLLPLPHHNPTPISLHLTISLSLSNNSTTFTTNSIITTTSTSVTHHRRTLRFIPIHPLTLLPFDHSPSVSHPTYPHPSYSIAAHTSDCRLVSWIRGVIAVLSLRRKRLVVKCRLRSLMGLCHVLLLSVLLLLRLLLVARLLLLLICTSTAHSML